MDPIEAAMIENEPSSRGRSWLLAILIVGAAAVGFTVWLKSSMQPVWVPSPRVGQTFPALEVEGWLNGPGPTADELTGKVLVVDAWAFWCGPCRMAAPSLIELAEQYRDRGVLFLGLTVMGARDLELSRQFLEETGIPWPNGYGAERPLEALNAETLPRVWIVGRDGKIVDEIVGYDPTHQAIRAGIERALAKAP